MKFSERNKIHPEDGKMLSICAAIAAALYFVTRFVIGHKFDTVAEDVIMDKVAGPLVGVLIILFVIYCSYLLVKNWR